MAMAMALPMATTCLFCPSSSSSSSSSSSLSSPWFFPLASRRSFLCSAIPPNRPSDEEGTIRPQVAPSVLRSLRSVTNPKPNSNTEGNHDSSSDGNPTSNTDTIPIPETERLLDSGTLTNPNSNTDVFSKPNAGESLIERNLRKRAASTEKKKKSVSTDGQESFEFPDPVTASDVQEFVTSSNGQNLVDLPVQSRVERYAKYENCPISNVFWEEKPQGLAIESFYNLDFHIKSYRLALLLSLLLESKDLVSSSSLLWFAFTPEMAESLLSVWKQKFPQNDDLDDLILKWKNNVAEELGKLINEKDVIQLAVENFSSAWETKVWSERVLSGEAVSLVTSVILSTEIDILLGASNDAKGIVGIKRRLENSSAGLSGALMQLHGPPLDPIDLWEKALKETPFTLNGDAFLYDYAIILPCKKGDFLHVEKDFGDVLRLIQDRLNADRQYSGLVAMLRQSSSSGDQNLGEFYLLIAPWYWVMPMDLSELMPISSILLIVSCIATSRFPSASLDIGLAWDPYAVPLGWLAIIGSIYVADKKNLPLVLPFWNFGAIGKNSLGSRNFPSRASYLNALAESAFAAIITSLLLIALGIALWGPSQYSLKSVFDLHGYVLVPPDLFSHSSVFSKLLQASSVAAVKSEDENLNLAISPFIVAGLLGLNFSAFSLFPGPHTDGAEILRNLLGNSKLADDIVFILSVLLTVSLFSHNPLLGLSWAAFSSLSGSATFVIDDVSEPNFLTRAIGFALVMGAVACFIPFPQ